MKEKNKYDIHITSIVNNVSEGYIFDTINNKKLYFMLKIGRKNILNKALVILHGHGANKNYAKYFSEEWTVICPLDKYGTEGFGCWWLGENGDFFVFNLLQNLIQQLKEQYELKQLYFWGSSMGGYGAILHGIIANAHAVYAHMPQIKLRGTDYTDGANSKFYTPIFGDQAHKSYIDLVEFISKVQNNNLPVLFLSQNVFDYTNYVKQHFFPLIQVLENKRAAFQVEMNLEKGHKLYKSISQSVELFEENLSKIQNWKNFQDINGGEKYDTKLDEFKEIVKKISITVTKHDTYVKVLSGYENTDCLYACYFYVNKKIHTKKFYQASTNFCFDLQDSTDDIYVKYYIWNTKYNFRLNTEVAILS